MTTTRLTLHRPEERRSEPVPISVAVAEAHSAIMARRRSAIRRLQRRATESRQKMRATG